MSSRAQKPNPVLPGTVAAFEQSEAAQRRLQESQRNEARTLALSIVRDPEYQQNLLLHARARLLHPQMETTLWAYAYGKPPDRIEIGRIGDTAHLEDLSKEELAQRCVQLIDFLKTGLDGSFEPVPAQAQTDSALLEAELAQQKLAEAGRIQEEREKAFGTPLRTHKEVRDRLQLEALLAERQLPPLQSQAEPEEDPDPDATAAAAGGEQK